MKQFLNRLTDDAVAIFLFHGVVKQHESIIRNYNRKHIDQEYFYKIITSLKQEGYALSMDDIVRHIQEGEKFPSKAFAITFDDGFENNFKVAAPILSDAGIPSMFYLTTDFIENNTMSWIDRIEYCLDHTGDVAISLPWNKTARTFGSTDEKIALLDEIRHHVKQMEELDVDHFVDSIFDQCNMETIAGTQDPLDKKLDWEQAKQFFSDPLFSWGGHTHTHQIMSFLSEKELETEIETSLELMQTHIGRPTKHYSYPEGLAHHYNSLVIEQLKKNGVICCPTAIDGINPVTEDLFHLKRIMVM